MRPHVWRELLEHFSPTPALLLIATPRRRDGRAIPGTHVYHYPLRIALEEGFYKPITPILLDAEADRPACDRVIARRAGELLGEGAHATSVLMVRAATIARLNVLREIYESFGVELTLLHYNLSEGRQREIVEGVRGGTIRAVGVGPGRRGRPRMAGQVEDQGPRMDRGPGRAQGCLWPVYRRPRELPGPLAGGARPG